METTLFLAKGMSIVLLALSLGYFLNPKHYNGLMKEYGKSKSTVFLHGYFETVLGFLLVMNHNIWVKDWTVLVTIIAWGVLLEGLFLLLFPEGMMGYTKYWMKRVKHMNLWLLLCLVGGGVLGYYGFGFGV